MHFKAYKILRYFLNAPAMAAIKILRNYEEEYGKLIIIQHPVLSFHGWADFKFENGFIVHFGH